MILIVCGDRHWTDKNRIYEVLNKLPKEYDKTIIIEGSATGADTLAFEWSKEHSITCINVPANWELHGASAGSIRNRRMFKDFGKIDEVIAFHNDFWNSKGTKDTVNYALSEKIPVLLVTSKEMKWLP
jgi:hypothetical protein